MGLKKEIAGWLRKNEQPFMEKLEQVGLRNTSGLQRRVGDKIIYDYRGEFTGAGLCILASGVIEAAAKQKFGDRIQTSGVVVNPKRRVETCSSHFLHRAMRIEVPEERASLTADATFRQYSFQSGNRVVIIPSASEKGFYQGNEVGTVAEGKTAAEAREYLGKGHYRNLRREDFEELVKVLVGD